MGNRRLKTLLVFQYKLTDKICEFQVFSNIATDEPLDEVMANKAMNAAVDKNVVLNAVHAKENSKQKFKKKKQSKNILLATISFMFAMVVVMVLPTNPLE
jgi:hypothetical protein